MGETFLTLGTVLKGLGFALSPLFLLPFLVLAAPRRLARPASALISLLDQGSRFALGIALWLAGVMVLVQILVIIGRYVFDWSASWASEIVIYSFAGLFLLASASALKADAHVRVDILREKMSPRVMSGVDMAGIYLFLIPICVLILWAAISDSFVRSWLQFEGSRESDGLPIYFLFRTLVPAFAVLVLSQGLAQALRAALILRGKESGLPLLLSGSGSNGD